jgi:NAD(P)-dependent dehydrogenase (short-subunit alcohol dehydrogenase family)
MSSASDQEPLDGRTVLITGGTGGIGYQTARALARRDAKLIITGRDAGAGQRAAAAIRRESGQWSVTFLQADHATVTGNQQLAEQVAADFPGLNVLVNNVGGLYGTRWETADSYEATLAMNFLGPFTLTCELLPLLQANAPAQCINVVSAAFKMWKPDSFQDLHSTRRFISGDAYARAKLLNVLFSLALARRVPAGQVTVNLVHPGLSWTQMTQSMTSQTIPSLRLVWPLVRLVQRHRAVLRGQAHAHAPLGPRARPREPGARMAVGLPTGRRCRHGVEQNCRTTQVGRSDGYHRRHHQGQSWRGDRPAAPAAAKRRGRPARHGSRAVRQARRVVVALSRTAGRA